jgi:hypothetical protein
MRSGLYVKNPHHVLGKLVEVAQGRLPVFQITVTSTPPETAQGSAITSTCGTGPGTCGSSVRL